PRRAARRDRRAVGEHARAPMVGRDARRGRRRSDRPDRMTHPHDEPSPALGDQGIVLSGTGGVWRVRRADGSVVEASLRGRVKKANSGKRADGSLRRDTISAAAETLKLTIGDNVVLEHDEASGAWAIAEILPRRSRL